MNEVERRKLKWESVKRAWDADPTYHQQRAELIPLRKERAIEALQLLDDLRRTRDVETFSSSIQAWSRRPGYAGRGAGMMFIDQVIRATDDPPVAAELLIDVLTEPGSEDAAAEMIRRCVAHVEKVRQGPKPAPKRAAEAPRVSSRLGGLGLGLVG